MVVFKEECVGYSASVEVIAREYVWLVILTVFAEMGSLKRISILAFNAYPYRAKGDGLSA